MVSENEKSISSAVCSVVSGFCCLWVQLHKLSLVTASILMILQLMAHAVAAVLLTPAPAVSDN